MQQSWLKQQVGKRLPAIQGAEEPLKALIYATYECVKESILQILNHDFGDGYLVIVGGIQINMPEPARDHFQPLFFQAQSKSGRKVDLLRNLQMATVTSFLSDIDPLIE